MRGKWRSWRRLSWSSLGQLEDRASKLWTAHCMRPGALSSRRARALTDVPYHARATRVPPSHQARTNCAPTHTPSLTNARRQKAQAGDSFECASGAVSAVVCTCTCQFVCAGCALLKLPCCAEELQGRLLAVCARSRQNGRGRGHFSPPPRAQASICRITTRRGLTMGTCADNLVSLLAVRFAPEITAPKALRG